ncbi:MAG TPA: RecX family transcriptional regulator [Candidatus Saccharibacteria bacterium]|nr:RecX family transcriptional regulator [Candidatus Saccharibacteria bacterium]
MLKITDIKQQVKRQDRYSIFIDDKYSFSLSENELMKSGIRLNREYTTTELEQLKQTAVLDKAYMRSLDMLSRRARSEWELRDYLRRKDNESEIIDQIITRLKRLQYIDDYIFAKAWVDNRRLLKATSKRKLSQELKQKRVEQSVIDGVLADDETDELAVIRELIAKKRTQSRYQDDQKLIAYLLRQGFSYSDVKEAMKLG